MESKLYYLQTSTHPGSSFFFSADGKTLVTSTHADQTVQIWDVKTGELKKTFTGLTTIALSPDGKTLASTANDKSIQLVDVETGELKNSLTGHSSTPDFIAFNPNGKTLVSRDYNSLILWDLKTNRLRTTIKADPKLCLFSPSGKILAISSYVPAEDGNSYLTITLWDGETAELIRTLSHKFESVAFSPDEQALFISYMVTRVGTINYPDGYSREYDYQTPLTRRWSLTTGEIYDFSRFYFCALSPDEKFFVGRCREFSCGVNYDKIEISNRETKYYQTLQGTAAVLSPDGKILAVNDGNVHHRNTVLNLFEFPSLTQITSLNVQAKTFCFSSDGNSLAIQENQTIKLFQKSTGLRITTQLHGDAYPHLKQLENLLAAELWEDADLETADVINSFPTQDLNVIDQLWIHYSKGHYGFSVQKQIWESIIDGTIPKSTINFSSYTNKEQFEYSLGWVTVDYNTTVDSDFNAFFRDAGERTRKGYYPRAVYKSKGNEFSNLPEMFARLGEVGSDASITNE